jgi:hypothetical protein
MAVKMKTAGFRDETSCSLIQNCKGFVGIIWPHLQGITKLSDNNTKTDESNTVPKTQMGEVKKNIHAQLHGFLHKMFFIRTPTQALNSSIGVLPSGSDMLHYAPRSGVSSASRCTRVDTTSLLQKLLLRQARVPHRKHTFPFIVLTVKIMQIIQYVTHYRTFWEKNQDRQRCGKLKKRVKILHVVGVDFSLVTDEQKNILLSHARKYNKTSGKKNKERNQNTEGSSFVLLSVKQQRRGTGKKKNCKVVLSTSQRNNGK